jgi:hypothetical protein
MIGYDAIDALSGLIMPWIIDYAVVVEQMRLQKLKCNYYNSGAFGFADPAGVQHVGWIGPDDPTLRPAAREVARPVPAPYEANLAEMLTATWLKHFPGRVWAMPMSHWAYELDYGSRDWLPALVEHIDLDPGLLLGRNNAAAIEFSTGEAHHFRHFTQRLLEMLMASDFMLAFVGKPILCTLHHHKQLWWTTTDPKVIKIVENAVPLAK